MIYQMTSNLIGGNFPRGIMEKLYDALDKHGDLYFQCGKLAYLHDAEEDIEVARTYYRLYLEATDMRQTVIDLVKDFLENDGEEMKDMPKKHQEISILIDNLIDAASEHGDAVSEERSAYRMVQESRERLEKAMLNILTKD